MAVICFRDWMLRTWFTVIKNSETASRTSTKRRSTVALRGAWDRPTMKVMSVASNDLMKNETERTLARLLPEIRIEADVSVHVKKDEENVRDVIHQESAEADLVLLGLATPPPGRERAYAERLVELASGLRSFFFVKNNSLFIGDLLSADTSKDDAPL